MKKVRSWGSETLVKKPKKSRVTLLRPKNCQNLTPEDVEIMEETRRKEESDVSVKGSAEGGPSDLLR